MKRILSFVLVIVMLLGVLPFSAMAATSFVDVPAGAYYTEPVEWAVSNNITSGTGGNKFSPDAICSRGQIVTFLWRATGCPAPTNTTCTFTDVVAGSYYYDAMLWAVEKNITTGTGGNKFSPDMACSRGQVVTFLWRAAGCPAPTNTTCDFTDAVAGSYYYDAMLWAVENNITTGTGGGKFSPNAPCTRAQVVTFLYRARDLLTPTQEPLTITQQPVNAVCASGDSAVFTVGVSGGTAPYSYQWQYTSNGLGYWNLPGISNFQVSADGTLTVLADADVFNTYKKIRCFITDKDGNYVISNPVTITEAVPSEEPLVISQQPTNATGVIGDTCQFKVTVSGGTEPYSYQWQYSQKDDTDANDFFPITAPDADGWLEGYDTDTLTVTVDSGELSEYYCYRCVITDDNGNSVTTDIVRVLGDLVVHGPYLDESEDPEVFTLYVSPSGGQYGFTYQWKFKDDNISNLTDLTASDTIVVAEPNTGVNSDYLVVRLTDSDLADNPRFCCEVTDAAGTTVLSEVLFVSKPLTITQQPQDVSCALGGKATFSVAAAGGTGSYIYNWQFAPVGNETYTNIAGNPYVNAEGFTTPNLTVTTDAGTYEYQFRCIITDENEKSVISDAAQLALTEGVTVPLTITYEPNHAVGEVGDEIAFTVYVDGGTEPYNYQWYWKSEMMSAFEAITDAAPDMEDYDTDCLKVTVTQDYSGMDLQFYCVITDQDGNHVTSKTVALNADYEDLTIETQPKTHGITVGAPAYLSVEVKGGMPPYEYQWCYSNKTTEMEMFGPADVASGWVRAWNSNQLTILTAKDNYEDRIGTDVNYWCVITDSMGHTITSAPANLTQSTLFIVKQPERVLSHLNESHTFTVECNGGLRPYTYQWLYKNDSMTDYAPLAKAHSAWAKNVSTDTLTLDTAFVPSGWFNSGYEFCCKITDGITTKYTVPVTIDLIDELTVVNTRGGFVPMDEEAEFMVEVAGGKPPYTYDWQWTGRVGIITEESWADFTTAQSWALQTDFTTEETSHTARLTRTTYSQNLYFRCVITDADGNKVATDKLSFGTPLSIQKHPANTVMLNGNGTFTVTATGGEDPYFYQWQYRTADMAVGEFINLSADDETWCGNWNTDTLVISGMTDQIQDAGYQFRCVVSDTAGNTATTFAVNAKKHTPLTVDAQPESAMVNIGEDYTVSVLGRGGSGKYTYNWYYMSTRTGVDNYLPVADLSWADADGKSLTVTPTDNQWYTQGYQFKCRISDGWNVYWTDAFSVNQALTIVTNLENQTVALGDAATFYISATGGNPIPFYGAGEYTFTWQRAPKSDPDNWRSDIIAMQWDYAVSYQLQISAVTEDDYDYFYRCTVTDADGTTVISNVVTLSKP